MYQIIKRALDIILSLVAMVILSPLLLVIGVLVKLDSPGPVVFQQERLGLHGKMFRIYKFRSMVVGAEHTGTGVYSERGDERVTRIGRVLRATSLDELPQLVNILRGDMSFIGPRPPLTYHPWTLEEYSPEQLRMFDVRPGITGWAQVNGRKCVEWNRRIEMNIWYVDHISFWLDIKILFMTVATVISNRSNHNNGETVLAGQKERDD